MYRILFLGDVVGKPGRRVLRDQVKNLTAEFRPNLIIANGENSAGGIGIDPGTTEEMFSAGVQVLTTGNHVWSRREFLPVLERESQRIVRPANYAPGAPGKGWCVWQGGDGVKVGIINVMGRVFMDHLLDCPYRTVDAILAGELSGVDLVFIDFHAEATSEKVAAGYYFDGRAAVLVGTHTHVQTADERVFAKGLAYISDVGMCGPRDSVIGMDVEPVVARFLSGLPAKFEVGKGPTLINGVLVECDPKTHRASSITRINRVYE